MVLGSIAGLSVLISAVVCFCCGCFETASWLWALPAGAAGCFLALSGLIFGWILFLAWRVDFDVPQEKDSRLYRGVTALCADVLKTAARLRVETVGLEKTPSSGRFLLVCNHLNNSDPVILLHYFRRSQLAFISKQENREMFLVGKLMHKLQCQLLDRDNDRDALRCILKCIQILQEDRASVAVFPEGYVSVERTLLPFRSGVFKIAQRAQVPIVVCTLQGTEDVITNFARLKPSRVRLHLLEVIPAEELAGKTTVQIAARVRALMVQDLDDDYLSPEDRA